MQRIRKRGLYEAGRIVYLPVGKITPNPDQPRRHMNPSEMRELAASITKYGVLQPLSVRRLGTGYELLAGERRLRAAMLAGLTQVPCIIMDVDTRESAVLMLVENLQRRGLDFIEEARGLSKLVNIYGYSQEEVARLVGLSQPAVANKLRLLKIPPEVLIVVREAGLTERHARALLRLESENDMAAVLEAVIRNDMNVAATDSYIDEFLEKKDAPPQTDTDSSQKSVFLFSDARFFLNSVERGVNLMRKAGIEASVTKEETGGATVITVTVRQKSALPGQAGSSGA